MPSIVNSTQKRKHNTTPTGTSPPTQKQYPPSSSISSTHPSPSRPSNPSVIQGTPTVALPPASSDPSTTTASSVSTNNSSRHTSRPAADDSSTDTIQGSQRQSIRLAICVVIEEGQNATKADFLTHLAKELNQIVEVCTKLNSDIKLIPWSQRSGLLHHSVDLFKPCPIHFKAFIYNFKPRSTHAGNHYFRLNLSAPYEVQPSVLNEHLDGWYTNWPRFAKIAPSSAQQPTNVGWFL